MVASKSRQLVIYPRVTERGKIDRRDRFTQEDIKFVHRHRFAGEIQASGLLSKSRYSGSRWTRAINRLIDITDLTQSRRPFVERYMYKLRRAAFVSHESTSTFLIDIPRDAIFPWKRLTIPTETFLYSFRTERPVTSFRSLYVALRKKERKNEKERKLLSRGQEFP